MLEQLILLPSIQTQSTITENIREAIKEHEERSKEEYLHRLIIKVAQQYKLAIK